MKLKKVLIAFSLVGALLLPVISFGAVESIVPTELAAKANCTKENPCTLNLFADLAINVAYIILGVVGGLTLLMFVIGGFVWITSGGSSDKVQKGKDIIIGSVVGLLIVFSSYMIVKYVSKDILQGKVTKNNKEYDAFSEVPPEEGSEKCAENEVGPGKGQCTKYTVDDKGVPKEDECKDLNGTPYGVRDCDPKSQICCLVEPPCSETGGGKGECKDNGKCGEVKDNQGNGYEPLQYKYRCKNTEECCVPPDPKPNCEDDNHGECKNSCDTQKEEVDPDFACSNTSEFCCVKKDPPDCEYLGGYCELSSNFCQNKTKHFDENSAGIKCGVGYQCCLPDPCLQVDKTCIPKNDTCQYGDAEEECLDPGVEKCCNSNPNP